MKKIIAMMLVLVMAIAMFASCVEEGEYEIKGEGEISINKKDETEPDDGSESATSSESGTSGGSESGTSGGSESGTSGGSESGTSSGTQGRPTDENGKKISEIKFPEDSLVLYLKRNGKKILPKECTRLKEGDRITLTLPLEEI